MKISRPTRPKAVVLTCYRCFLRARVRPFRADAGQQRALRGGRETNIRPTRLPGGRDRPTVGDLQPCRVQSVQHHERFQGDPPRYQHPGKQAEL